MNNTAQNIKAFILDNPELFDTRLKTISVIYFICKQHDQTESDTNITNVFYFQDDSILNIDTENFVYCDEDSEAELNKHWEQQ